MLVKAKRGAAVVLALLMMLTLLPFVNPSQTYAEDATIESVRTAILALSADPTSYTADDKEHVEAIWADFQSLSAADQATLDSETTHTGTSQPLGRVLESALWSVWSYAEIDNSTTLGEGVYNASSTPALSSAYSKGKSTSGRQKPWSVKDVTVDAEGNATATIAVESDTYSGIWIGGTTYPKTNSSGNCEFAGVPIDLNSTFYFAGISTSMPTPIAFSLTTEITEPDPSSEPEKIDLGITNNTGMFKAVTAYLEKTDDATTLVMALSGTGYKELFKGTYEQAVANGDGSADKGNDSWIHGYTNDAGLLEFRIPINAGETYVPCVAISNSYYTKYLNGTNALERAFYPRQFEVNEEAKTLVTGDYDETADFAVTSNVADFKVGETASTRVVGGPNSNNYNVAPTLVMSDATYDKVTYPTVVSGKVSEASTDLKDGKFAISLLNAPNKEAFKDKTPIEMKFHVAADAPYAEAGTDVVRNVTIDKMAKTITIDGDALTEKSTEPEKIDLAITNNTGMFKAVTAYLEKTEDATTLVMALSGTGYKELFKGTYEQAVANGANTDNWIHGATNADGKWEFRIPVAENESYIPIVAISNSYYTKYLNGQNALERAFYPRQMELDVEAKTLTTDDYAYSQEIAVTNNVKMFKPGTTATLETVGGPNSNNYAAQLVLPMQNNTFKKVYVGTYAEALEAQDADTIALNTENNTFTIPVKWVETFGDPSTLKTLTDGEQFAISFYSKAWYERLATLDEETGTLVFDASVADYSAVDAAKAKVPEDLTVYTDETAEAVTEAVAAVATGKFASQQAEVDAMAKAIEDAVAALEKKPADYSKVEEAKAKAAALDKDLYTADSLKAVEDAVKAVEEGKKIDEQDEVDAMAKAIEDAIAAAEKKPADYSKVEEAKEKAAALDKDLYTADSVKAVEDAVKAVEEGKKIDEQDEVDAMAQAIEDAITALSEKALEYTFDPVSEWVVGSGASFDFTVHRSYHDSETFDHFVGIEVDGKAVDASNYTAVSGSLKGSLKASYMETLSEGKHTLKANFDDGSAETNFTVTKKAADNNKAGGDNTKTGDNNNMTLWIIIMALALAAGTTSVILVRRKTNNR